MVKNRTAAVLMIALLAGTQVTSAAAQGYYDRNADRYDSRTNDPYATAPNDTGRYDDGRYDNGRYDNGRYGSGQSGGGQFNDPYNRQYAPPPDDSSPNPGDRYAPPPDDRYGPPPDGRYAPPPDDRYGPVSGAYDTRAAEAYRHDYVPQDDPYYRDCQQQRAGNTAGGLIIGALAGGLLGNALSGRRDRGAGTAAGAILGGALGAGIGNSLNCEDRNYAYRAYYAGFEAGRPHTRYDWRSPRGPYGYLEVGDYYRDRDGYRCATYAQTIYVRGRPVISRGHACRQRNGVWAFID